MTIAISREKWLPILFFTVLFTAGVLVFRDYGVHYDEKCQIAIGVTNYRYINQGDPTLLDFQDRYYGPLFELIMVVLFHNIPAPGMIYARHFSVFLTFFVGCAAFYLLARRLFGKTGWALLACLLLVTSPRIFADAFYNSKDIPFMVVLVIGMTSLVYWLDLIEKEACTRTVWMSAILHAVISAAAVAIRIPGLLLMGITIGIIGLYGLTKPGRRKVLAVLLVVYTVLAFVFLVGFMPVLWHDPVGEFINAIGQMSRYNLWQGSILFQGNIFPANNPVWTYLPVWIGITTPYLPLAAFIVGFLIMVITAIRARRSGTKKILIRADDLAWLAVVAWFIVPVAALYLFRSVLYDAWRQMFFIYPPMVLIAVFGIRWIFTRIENRYKSRKTGWNLVLLILLWGTLIAGILHPLVWMVRNHPHEYVYFNGLAGERKTLRWQYDLDYWGLSYKHGIDQILATDSRDHIKLSAVSPPALYVEYMLPGEDAARLTFVDVEDADYFLTNYRWHPDDFPYPEKFFSVYVDEMEIMTVYRLREPVGNYGN